MTSRAQKRKAANTSALAVEEAFIAYKNQKIRVLAAWSAMLKDAAPWRTQLRYHMISHFNIFRSLNNNMIMVAAGPGNAIV